MILLMALFAPLALHAQTDLTVCDGTVSNQYVPIYGYWADNSQHNQMIFPASQLSAMTGKAISKMVFYIDASNTSNGSNTSADRLGTWTVSLGETTATTLSGLDNTTAVTQVYQGYFDCSNGTTVTLAFQNDYTYNGGNLLVDITHAAASYNRWYFLGVEATSAAVYQYGSYDPYTQNFLPKTTFTYATPASCTKPSGLTATLTEGNGTVATLAWTENGDATMWEICLNGDETNLITATTNPYTLTGLTPETAYTAKVRANCGGGDTSLWTDEVTFKPTNAVALTVNDGTTTNGYVPIYGYWCDNITKSQFIIPADDLADMEGGTITKMTFFGTMTGSYSNWGAAKFEVYMAETTETTLSALADYGTLDLVMNAASINIVNGEMVVEFDTPYQYMGGNLMIGFLQTVTGQYSSCSWTGVTAEGASMGGYGSSISQQNFLPKIKFAYLPGEAPSCPKPRNLTVSNVTSHTADLSWTAGGDETACQICHNGDERNPIDVTTTTYTLTGLTAETTYYVKVRANCGSDDDSDWTTEISFTTDIACPAPTNLTVNLTPNSATMAWNGSADEYEMEYAVLGSGASGTITYEFENDLQGWTNIIVNADQGEWLHSSANLGGYDYTEVAHGGTGFALCYSYVDYVGAYNTDAYLVSPNAYQINAGASLNFWYDMANDTYPEYFEVCVATAANPTASDFTAIWTWSESKNRGEAFQKIVKNSNTRHRNHTRSGNWREVTVDLNDYVGQTIWIALHDVNEDMYEVWIDDVTVDAGSSGDITWIPVGTVTSPYTLEGLDPETFYMVRVRSVCGGEDGESAWVNTTFTTLSMCDAPTNLSVTNLMPTTATLNWNGYQDGFEVRYRVAAGDGAIFFEGFEDLEDNALPEGWTTIDSDGDGNAWYSLCDANWAEYSHGGQGLVTSASYNGEALTPDNWLITPQIALQGTMKVWLRAQDPSWVEEHYAIYLSTNGNTVADFTTTLVEESYDLSGEYIEVTADLSSYNGQPGYIAIRHFNCTDMFRLNLDDFGIYDGETPAGEWITVTTDGQFVDIEDLDPETEYEWQVRGEHRGCDNGEEVNYTPWSEMGTFTTPGECDLPNSLSAVAEATSATLNWIGYQESFNVQYRIRGFDGYYLNETWDDEIGDWGISNVDDETNIYQGEGIDDSNCFIFMYNTEPPQYLISPDLRPGVAGNTLTFQYKAYSEDYEESFIVVFDGSEMDEMISDDEITTSNTEWQTYTTVIPEGTEYFIIAYTANDQFALLLDNFVIYNANDVVEPGTWVPATTSESTLVITGLTPTTEYEWQVQGVNCDGEGTNTEWVTDYFTTDMLTTLVQTIELAEGSNWISFYVETDLDALKAALEEVYAGTNMTIRGMNGYTSYNGTRWRGPLTSLDMSQMYMIEVAEVGRIVVEGEPLNPADLAITINEDANWIGFPFSESMAIQDAFEGFATNGDILRSQDGYTTYNGTRWRGNISILVPGQGYIYNSTTNKDDFYYPTNTSKAAQTGKIQFEKKSLVPAIIMPFAKIKK